jgi:hypothetical protein
MPAKWKGGDQQRHAHSYGVMPFQISPILHIISF